MIDLQPFCMKGKGKFDLAAPFVLGGVRYASDGRILVGVPAPGELNAEGMFPQDVSDKIARPAAELLLPWPAIEVPPPQEVDCSLCSGMGSCPTCEQDCPDCHGTGKEMSDVGEVELGPQTHVANKYFRLVAALPGEKKWHQPEPLKAIYFCFDGGEGALIPMKVNGNP